MKVIKADLPRELGKVDIHTFADLHLGDKFTDFDLIQRRIAAVMEDPTAFVILNGDLMNNATKTSVSDSYAENLTPMEQIAMCARLFKPMADTGKIIAMTHGNHENRTYRKEGIDLTEILARELGVDDRYSKTSCLVFLRFGSDAKGRLETNGSGEKRKQCYTIYVAHGSGGGRKEGAKVIRLADMASIVDADVYIHSHTHLPVTMKQCFHRIDTRNSTVAAVDKLFVNTAATLNYGGYGEALEFKPSSKETPVIHLFGDVKYASATL